MELKVKTFSQLSNTELYAILKLRVDVFVVEQSCPYPEIDGRDEDSLHVWLEEEGEILAYASWTAAWRANMSQSAASLPRAAARAWVQKS